MEVRPPSECNSSSASHDISSFMEHECAWSRVEAHNTGPYPEPDDTGLHRYTLFLKDLSYILPHMYAQIFPSPSS
jgi:hypothetical protein